MPPGYAIFRPFGPNKEKESVNGYVLSKDGINGMDEHGQYGQCGRVWTMARLSKSVLQYAPDQ